MRLPGLLLSIGILWPCEGRAQQGHSDTQLWSSLSVTAPIGDAAEVRVDGLVQFTDDMSRVGRGLGRVVVLAKVDDRLKLGGGYVLTRIDPGPGVHFIEHRLLQEVDFRTPLSRTGVALTLRTQFEQRWREGLDGTSLRLRQLSRIDVPIEKTRLGAVLWNEYFHEFRTTEWSGPKGSGLMLNFVGIHLPLSRRIAVEPGYLNQTQFDAGSNRVRHVISISTRIQL